MNSFKSNNYRIAFLDDHRYLIPDIEKCFISEWSEYYGSGDFGCAKKDLLSFCNKKELPLCLIAVEGRTFYGSVALRHKSASHHHLTPWLTFLYVVSEMRQTGIGTHLVNAACEAARELGYTELYARSATAVGFFKKNHWLEVDTIKTERLSVFKTELN